MSDDTSTLDTDDLDIRGLRDEAGKVPGLTDENVTLRRELLFAKVGVDTDTTLGKMLFKTFDGGTVDELRALAVEVGAIKDPGSDPHPDAGQQDFRNLMGGGAPPAVDLGPDPWDVGLNAFHAARKRGVPASQARYDLAVSVLAAAAKGDRRVLFDPIAHAREAAEADRMAML